MDLSDETLDDLDANPDYQEELETNDSYSSDSEIPVSASTSKFYPNRTSITTRSPLVQSRKSRTISQYPLPQPNPNLASQSPPPQSGNMFDNIVWTDPIGN
ncbi:hypothetical protein QE152_g30865 [Popillia japonica]|uniref:Uncharacterized protein n=1 Tax=Popillia japonica TaxID=7064 RepID=A0AAW1JDD3_POPJA